MNRILTILGAGGHGRVVADSAVRMGRWNFIQFFDDNVTNSAASTNFRIAGTISEALNATPNSEQDVFVGLGNNCKRIELQTELEALGWSIATIVDPSAVISDSAILGPGTIVMPGTVVNNGAIISAGCILNTRSSIDHDCHLGAGVHVSPGATLAGGVELGPHCWVGSGATIIPNVTIGEGTIVGAGAVVINDITDNATCAGVPAKVIR